MQRLPPPLPLPWLCHCPLCSSQGADPHILAKEREAQNVRLILTVKRNGLNESVIAERLVKLYG